MINFFSLPFRFKNLKKYKTLNNIVIISLSAALLSLTGCISTPPVEKRCPESKMNIPERLKNAEAVKNSLLKQLENPKNVDETIRVKEHLDKLQDEIDILNSGKNAKPIIEDDGFKNVKEKKVYYGPIGLIVETTQWILEKLWIIHET